VEFFEEIPRWVTTAGETNRGLAESTEALTDGAAGDRQSDSQETVRRVSVRWKLQCDATWRRGNVGCAAARCLRRYRTSAHR